MSWYTWVDFDYIYSEELGETPEFDLEQARAEIELLVISNKYHRDVAKDICDLVTKKEASFKLISYAVIELLSGLAEKYPQISFAVRGRGEDIRDIWLREYAGGKNILALGPPEGASL